LAQIERNSNFRDDQVKHFLDLIFECGGQHVGEEGQEDRKRKFSERDDDDGEKGHQAEQIHWHVQNQRPKRHQHPTSSAKSAYENSGVVMVVVLPVVWVRRRRSLRERWWPPSFFRRSSKAALTFLRDQRPERAEQSKARAEQSKENKNLRKGTTEFLGKAQGQRGRQYRHEKARSCPIMSQSLTNLLDPARFGLGVFSCRRACRGGGGGGRGKG